MNSEYEALRNLIDTLNKTMEERFSRLEGDQKKVAEHMKQIAERITQRAEVPVSSIPAKKLLELFTQILQDTQKSIIEMPGAIKYSIGPFKPAVRATIQYDDKGELILNLPQPGDTTPPELLSDILFDINPIPWEPAVTPDEVFVPDLLGLSLKAAEEKLAEAGLEPGKITRVQTETSSDIVLKQNPAAGLVVLKGSKVDITISEQAIVKVPLVVGLQVRDAQSILAKLELGVKIGKEIESDQPSGQVLSQKPAAGEEVKRGTIVYLDISKAPAKLVEVPNVLNKPLKEAQGTIEKTGLKTGSIAQLEMDMKAGLIAGQDPLPGKMVVPKTEIHLTVSRGILVEVPSLFGLQFNLGKEVLKSIDLKARAGSQKESEQPPGEILDQQPAAGERVEKGTTVDLVISKGKETKRRK